VPQFYLVKLNLSTKNDTQILSRYADWIKKLALAKSKPMLHCVTSLNGAVGLQIVKKHLHVYALCCLT